MNIKVKTFLTYYINKYYLNKSKNRLSNNYFQFYVTTLCLEKCSYCYLKQKNKKESSISEIIEALKKIIKKCEIDNKNLVLDLIGGDPLLKNGIFEIIDFLKDNKVNYGIKGNPHLVKKYQSLLKISKINRFQLSLDGLEKIHDSFRSKGSFKQTLASIKLLNKLEIPVFIKYTVSSNNIDEIFPLLLFLYQENIKIAGFATARYFDEHLDKTFSKVDMEYFFDKSFEAYLKLYSLQLKENKLLINIIFKEHMWYPYLYKKGLILDEVHNTIIDNPFSIVCSVISSNSHIIESDGFIKFCPKLPKENPTKFLEVASKEQIFLQEKIKKISCIGCFFKNVCLGCPAFHIKKQDNLFIDKGCFLYTKLF